MREDVDFFPARKVQRGTGGQEIETGLGQLRAAFARQHGIQRGLELVQMGHVIGGVSELLFRQVLARCRRRLRKDGQAIELF